MLRGLIATLTIGVALAAQDARSFKELSLGSPGCPRVNDTSVGAHRAAGARPLKDAAVDEVIAKGSRRNVAAFGATDLNGQLKTLADLKGRIVVVGFWSTRCEPSMKMLQEFRNFQQQVIQLRLNLTLWPVHFEPWPEVMSFLRTKKTYFDGVEVMRLGLGEHGLSNLVNELDSLPTVFLIDKEGGLAAMWSGYQENLLLSRVNRLLAER
ncbi:MAG: TlpA family protein disulfide reductase [Holophagaceae bacterium]|nr:TlpA family protein disulfide reductase [Holophagaceae bacterium]